MACACAAAVAPSPKSPTPNSLSPLLRSSPLLTTHTQGIDRRERLRRLAMETIDLAKDPYYMRNHLGQVQLFGV